nr:molybdopterin-dependent oxidoreductase [Klebsiella pneumoniae subsp. pneumoniae]
MPAGLWLQLRRPHPIVARRVIKARDNGAKIIVCDPRRIETARIADRHLQLNNGSNMALVNAFGYVLLEEELYNKTYVERYTEGLDAYREAVKDYAPKRWKGLSGSARGNPGGDAHVRRPIRHHYVGHGGHPVWPGGGRGARPGKPGAAHRQPGTAQRRRGRSAGKTTYRAPAIWACCRTCFPAIRRSPTPPCGRNCRRLGHRPGADGRPCRHPHH